MSVSGVGPNSYHVAAADRTGNRLLLVDPVGCGTTAVAVEAGPVAVIPIARYEWQGAYVLNHARRQPDLRARRRHDDAARVRSRRRAVDRRDHLRPEVCRHGAALLAGPDPLGGPDDLRLSWDPCPGVTQYSVWCTCLDEHPDCSCRCDCDNPAPGCSCPPEPVNANNGINMIQAWPPPDEYSLNPWKKLDDVFVPEFIDPDQWEGQNQQAYGVTEFDEVPPPP